MIKALGAGTYELEGNRLVMKSSPDPSWVGFQWSVRSADRLLLVDGPPVSNTGSSYIGATLSRIGGELKEKPTSQPTSDAQPDLKTPKTQTEEK